MSDTRTPQAPVVIQVEPGTQETAQVLCIDGDLIAVRLLDLPHTPIIPLQVGSILILPGYERVWKSHIAGSLTIGKTVHLVWIGTSDAGVIQASVSAGSFSLDHDAIGNGWALPRVTALKVPTVGLDYRGALESAAHQLRGGFGDARLSHALKDEASGLLGPSHNHLAPSFFAAHPAFCVTLVMVMLVAIAIGMRADNRSVQAANATTDSSVRRGLRWAIDMHLRFLRPSGLNRKHE